MRRKLGREERAMQAQPCVARQEKENQLFDTMASFGRLTASLFNASQENTMALLNLNFDFAMIKCDAPAEYKGLGKALSTNRKNAAENGELHIVARKLGALFSSDIPDVPDLVRAYGERVSEIAQMPNINPKGSTSHGAFADHVGVDGTTIWATATSGKSVITIHLLACMLARIWKQKEAISIWNELVEQRKELLRQKTLGESFQISEAVASRIDIPRSQLAAWDASARSVQPLRSIAIAHSGQGMASHYRRGEKSSTNPTSTHSRQSTAHCIDFFRSPQLCVGSSDQPGGIITVGLESNINNDAGGIRWSLPLAHLKYYGDPLLSEGHTGLGDFQVTLSQFLCVALGSIVGGWGFRSRDVDDGLHLIIAIDEGLANVFDQSLNPSYISVLASAVRQFWNSENLEREELRRLIYYGQRKCAGLLAPAKQHPPSLFGLSHSPHILRCLPPYLERFRGDVTDEPVSILREVVTSVYDKATLAGGVIEFGRPDLRYTHLIPEKQLKRDDDSWKIRSTVWSWQTYGATRQYQSCKFSDVVDLPPGPGEDVKEFVFLCGVPKFGAVYLPSRRTSSGKLIPLRVGAAPICQVQKLLNRGFINKEWWAYSLIRNGEFWSKRFPTYFRSLEALVDLNLIYSGLPGARVDLRAASRPISDAAWCIQRSVCKSQSPSISADIAFSCIAYFETGHVDLEPKTIQNAMAISCESNLYVSTLLLQDPQETPNVPLTRITGNIGKPGLSVLASPTNPRVLQVNPDSWKVVAHEPFDGIAQDSFASTSLHLCLTGYELTFDLGDRGSRDSDARIVEAAISLHDQGKWIADLDIVKASKVWKRYRGHPNCAHTDQQRSGPLKIDSLVSVDSWIEFLEQPLSSAIFRAQGNTLARLAAATPAEQKAYNAFIITPSSCWSCLVEYFTAHQQTVDSDIMFI
ncbi:hypothetical protein BU24DRAFT_410730 [Aaosphaeria arxii CBS 175.79]|uniref:Uncharacterized protein n=1 Tax=Aaosphaeria arxii CBS 175.79 TaxID=1450172 RepID=A0A6A5XQL6_9PLEO|nr:uncharacterized protein BU24DRAFT_410730 [Aaosphaeria arxii CBS 175.79]KAF2015051.1 hypothetical protein BU24DRAFT_410730 [Aaosphaeria arxii CBS 175.79]